MNNSAKPKVEIRSNHTYTTSIEIARYYNKAHRNVMRAINEILKHTSDSFIALNFERITVKDSRGWRVYRDQITKLATRISV